jgi:hypothetical protein
MGTPFEIKTIQKKEKQRRTYKECTERKEEK